MFIAPEDHHITSEKMARIDAIEESLYHDRVKKYNKILQFQWSYMDLFKLCGVPIRKDSTIKGNSLWY